MDGSNHIDTALRGYADRIVRLDEEKKALNQDRAVVFTEAKDAGFNVTTLREIVREMQMEPDARNARYQLLDEYRAAVGLLADTPLGRAAEPSGARTQPANDGAAQPRRGPGRPRKTSTSVDEALARARRHIGDEEPAGTA
jgi:uncharacterized protein (UPF0335 family)